MLGELSKEQQLILLALVLVIITGLGVMGFRSYFTGKPEEIMIEGPKAEVPTIADIVVHVSGAVKREGVYKLKPGDRIMDAIEFAGGAEVNANLASLNLAEKVKDGQKIVVPLSCKAVEGRSENQGMRKAGASSGPVNINSAKEEELCKVAGIGPATAQKIIKYRTANGPFTKISDLMKVKSIGKGKFEKIKEQIII